MLAFKAGLARPFFHLVAGNSISARKWFNNPETP
jgi:hypothetical protein